MQDKMSEKAKAYQKSLIHNEQFRANYDQIFRKQEAGEMG
jgi:hypothetical protein